MLLYPRGGGGKTDIPVIPDSEYVQEEDMVTHITAPPGWDVALPMGGGGGLAVFSESGPTLAFFVLIKGHTTIFFLFLGGGGRNGGQPHLGIPCP